MRALGLGLIAAFVAVGCNGSDKDGSDEDGIIPGTSAGCGENAPVIEELTITDGGMHEFEQDTFWPSILITADVSDEDQDLTYYTMRVWHDDVVDGRVLAEGEYFEVNGTLSGDDCEVPAASITMRLAITGSGKSPDYATETEFGVVMMDEEDNESDGGEPLEAVFFTPDAEGNYPE